MRKNPPTWFDPNDLGDVFPGLNRPSPHRFFRPAPPVGVPLDITVDTIGRAQKRDSQITGRFTNIPTAAQQRAKYQRRLTRQGQPAPKRTLRPAKQLQPKNRNASTAQTFSSADADITPGTLAQFAGAKVNYFDGKGHFLPSFSGFDLVKLGALSSSSYDPLYDLLRPPVDGGSSMGLPSTDEQMRQLRASDPMYQRNPVNVAADKWLRDSGVEGALVTAGRAVVPTATGAAGAGIGAEIGLLGGPFAPLTVPVGAIAGSLIGGYLGNQAQDEALRRTGNLGTFNAVEADFASKHPIAHFAVGQAPSLLFGQLTAPRTLLTRQGLRSAAGEFASGTALSAAQQLVTTGKVDLKQASLDGVSNALTSGPSTMAGQYASDFGSVVGRPLTQLAPWASTARANPGTVSPHVTRFFRDNSVDVGDLRFDRGGTPVQVLERLKDGRLLVQRQGDASAQIVTHKQLLAQTPGKPADTAAYTVLGIQNRETFRGALKAIGRPRTEAEALSQLVESHARGWATATGKDPGEYYRRYIAGLTKGDADTVRGLLAPHGEADSVENYQGVTDPVARHTDTNDTRMVMAALMAPDRSTMLHEMGHVFRRALADADPEGFRAVSDWAGAPEGTWAQHHEELFARAYEHWLKTGKAPNPSLTGVFAKYRQWLSEVYDKVHRNILGQKTTNSALNAIPFSPDVLQFLAQHHGNINETVGKVVAPEGRAGIPTPHIPLASTDPMFQRRPLREPEFITSPRSINPAIYTTYDLGERIRLLYDQGLVFPHRPLDEARQRDADAGIITAQVKARADADRLVSSNIFHHDGKDLPVLFAHWDGEAGGAKGDARVPLVGVNGSPLSQYSAEGGLHSIFGPPNGQAAILSDVTIVTGLSKRAIEAFYQLQKDGRQVDHLPVIVNRISRDGTSGNLESHRTMDETLTKAISAGQYKKSDVDKWAIHAYAVAQQQNLKRNYYPLTQSVSSWSDWNRYAPTSSFNARTLLLQQLLKATTSGEKLPSFSHFTNAMLDPRMVNAPNPHMSSGVLTIPHPTDSSGKRLDLVALLDGLTDAERDKVLTEIARGMISV